MKISFLIVLLGAPVAHAAYLDVTTLAGDPGIIPYNVYTDFWGSSPPLFSDGTGVDAMFSDIGGIVYTSDDTTLYVADTSNSMIRKVDVATGTVTSLAGIYHEYDHADGLGTNAKLNNPVGLLLSPDDATLYIADMKNHNIRSLNISTKEVTTLLGGGSDGVTSGYDDGIGTNALFERPADIAADSAFSNLYVTDNINHLIRKVVVATWNVTWFAGVDNDGYVDGVGTVARFDSPWSIVLSADDTFAIISDRSNCVIRKLVITTQEVTTLAGGGDCDVALVDGTGTSAT